MVSPSPHAVSPPPLAVSLSPRAVSPSPHTVTPSPFAVAPSPLAVAPRSIVVAPRSLAVAPQSRAKPKLSFLAHRINLCSNRESGVSHHQRLAQVPPLPTLLPLTAQAHPFAQRPHQLSHCRSGIVGRHSRRAHGASQYAPGCGTCHHRHSGTQGRYGALL